MNKIKSYEEILKTWFNLILFQQQKTFITINVVRVLKRNFNSGPKGILNCIVADFLLSLKVREIKIKREWKSSETCQFFSLSTVKCIT